MSHSITTRWVQLFLVVWVLVLVASCQQGNTDEPAAAVAGTPTLLAYEGDDPLVGHGHLYGQILWNGAGAEGLELVLCTDFSSFDGCGGLEYETETKDDGIYLFEDVKPGTYALAVRVFETESWLYVGRGILNSYDFEVLANDVVEVEPQHIFKLDLDLMEPATQSEVSRGDVTLLWEEYPDTISYRVYLSPEQGDPIYVDQPIYQNELPLNNLLPLNCEYFWSISAFNKDGIKIAEALDYSYFTVVGEESSCHLDLTTPEDGSTIPGDDIVLTWEAHPLADHYEVWLQDSETTTTLVSFSRASEARYEVKSRLAPSQYIWSVTAHDESGDEIAGSGVFGFTVQP